MNRRVLLLEKDYSISVLSGDKVEMLPKFSEDTLLSIKWHIDSCPGSSDGGLTAHKTSASWKTSQEAQERTIETWKNSHGAQERQWQPLVVEHPFVRSLLEENGVISRQPRAQEDAEPVVDTTKSSDHGIEATTSTTAPTTPSLITRLNIFLLFLAVSQLPLTLLSLAFVDWSSPLFQTGCAIGIAFALSVVFYFGR